MTGQITRGNAASHETAAGAHRARLDEIFNETGATADERRAVVARLDAAEAAIRAGHDPADAVRDLETILGDQTGAAAILFAAIPTLLASARQVVVTPRVPANGRDETEVAAGPDVSALRLLDSLAGTQVVGVCIQADDGTILQANQRLSDIFGQPVEEVIGNRIAGLLDRGHARQSSDGERQHGPGLSIRRRDGTEVHIVMQCIDVAYVAGQPGVTMCLVDDEIDRRVVEKLQRNSEERIQALVQNLSDVIAIVSTEGTLDYVSDSIERILGYAPADLVGRNVLDLVPVESQGSLTQIFDEVLEGPRDARQTSTRVAHRDGSWRWMEIDLTNLADVPSVGGVVVTARDVTRRKSVEQQLERLAYYDTLTSLPNRMHFRERLDAAVAAANEADESVAVIFLDLDRFKMINDQYGHDAGDNALVTVSQRILDSLLPGEMVARLGGDEFAVLVERATGSRALKAANRILAAISGRLPDHHRVYNLEASAGVAVSSYQLPRPGELLRAADIALYRSKALGGGVATLFTTGMYDAAIERAEQERSVQQALVGNEMVPWFQPEYDLESNRITSLEVLMRWQHGDGTIDTPEAFLDVATDLGLIVPMGLGILREACRRAVAWTAALPASVPVRLSFNVSEREVAQPDFPAQVDQVLQETGLDPTLLAVEIDDQVFHKPGTRLDRFVLTMRELGMDVIVDGVGGGHASWNQLRRLRPDRLKLHRDVLGSMQGTEVSQAIVHSVTTMARMLGVPVTAVGLEDTSLVARAVRGQCQRGQGSLLARPVPAADILPLLQAQANVSNA